MIWMRRGITALAGLLLVAIAVLFGGSGLVMRRAVDAELPSIQAATDPASIAEGTRLAGILGCTRCHGGSGQGRVLENVPYLGQIIAPSLPQIAARATDGQLARAVRNGVGIDARPLFLMPSDAFNHLSNDDVARLMGWMRSLPTTAFDIVGTTPVGVRGRFAILTGRLPDSVAPAENQPARRPADVGRYFTQISCQACHALGQNRTSAVDGSTAPALARGIASYDSLALRALLRTGKGHGGRALPTMAQASRAGLGALSDGEIEAIRTSIAAMGGR
jgi:cytochrome c553